MHITTTSIYSFLFLVDIQSASYRALHSVWAGMIQERSRQDDRMLVRSPVEADVAYVGRIGANELGTWAQETEFRPWSASSKGPSW